MNVFRYFLPSFSLPLPMAEPAIPASAEGPVAPESSMAYDQAFVVHSSVKLKSRVDIDKFQENLLGPIKTKPFQGQQMLHQFSPYAGPATRRRHRDLMHHPIVTIFQSSTPSKHTPMLSITGCTSQEAAIQTTQDVLSLLYDCFVE